MIAYHELRVIIIKHHTATTAVFSLFYPMVQIRTQHGPPNMIVLKYSSIIPVCMDDGRKT